MCFENEQPPTPPPLQQAPMAPSPGALSRESIAAQIEAAPQVLALNKEQLPQMAQLFTDIQKAQAPQIAQLGLEQEAKFGPQMLQLALDKVKQTDPTGFAIRAKLGEQTLRDLGLEGALSPEEQRMFEQDIRGGQMSRGLGTEFSSALSEAQQLGGQRFNRAEQRKADAAAFLAGRTPESSFTNINQAGKQVGAPTQDVSGFSFSGPSTNALMSAGLSGAGMNAANTNAFNQAQQGQYQFGVANTTNPFMTGLGIAAQLGGTLGGAAIGKWG